jgi:hypothetical protein
MLRLLKWRLAGQVARIHQNVAGPIQSVSVTVVGAEHALCGPPSTVKRGHRRRAYALGGVEGKPPHRHRCRYVIRPREGS